MASMIQRSLLKINEVEVGMVEMVTSLVTVGEIVDMLVPMHCDQTEMAYLKLCIMFSVQVCKYYLKLSIWLFGTKTSGSARSCNKRVK